MRTLAFDPGTANLGVCVFDRATMRGVHYDVWDVRGENTQAVVENVIVKVRDLAQAEHFRGVDHVLIETQPPRSFGNVKTVSIALFTAYVFMRVNHSFPGQVRFVKARSSRSCKNYKQRKLKGINLFSQREPQHNISGSNVSHVADAYNLAHDHAIRLQTEEKKAKSVFKLDF